MSGLTEEAVDDLIEAWLDDRLDPTQAEALQAWLAEDADRVVQVQTALRFRRQLNLALGTEADGQFAKLVMRHLSRQSTGRFVRSARFRRARRRPTFSVVRMVAAACAACLLVGLGLVLFQAPAPVKSDPATMAVIESGVLIGEQGRFTAWTTLPAEVSLRAEVIATVRTRAGGSVVVRPGTSLQWRETSGVSQITLTQGELYIHTKPGDHGMAVLTAHGRARPQGTRFGVAVDPAGLELGVIDGVVQMDDARRADTIVAGVLIRMAAGSAIERLASDPWLRFSWATGAAGNRSDAQVNLALAADAVLSGSVPAGTGRGSLREILFDPQRGDYVETSEFNEYGVEFEASLGVVTEADPFHWTVTWPTPMNVNYLTIGGSYPNQPQPHTAWRVQVRRDGTWQDLARGVGDWIDQGTYVWGGPGAPPIVIDGFRVLCFSTPGHPLQSIHLRGRGGRSLDPEGHDQGAPTRATLVQFLPPVR